MTNPGRNDPCPCGSGKKFKRCCGINSSASHLNRSGAARQELIADGGKAAVGTAMRDDKAACLAEAQRNYQLGDTFAAQGKMGQATVYYERALRFKPDYAEVHSNLGLALATQGRTDQAVAHCQRAVALQPNSAKAHNNLGLALAAQGKIGQAVAHYQRAVVLQPIFPEAYNNLGIAHAAQGKIDQAVVYYERALKLKPDYAEAHNNLGNTLVAQGKIGQALTHYERVFSLRPNDAVAHSSMLTALNYAPVADPVTVHRAHLDYAKRREAPLARLIQAPANDRTQDRRLKIGYVSSDFRQHSVAHFIEPVLEHHDHDRFEVFCYFNYSQKDVLTNRLQMHTDHWRNIFSLDDELVANQIRSDHIDILIDLNGHTAFNRLLVFARKPAPIQVTWLGYPNTTGLSTMDYRLTDGFADPVGMTEHLHSEKLVRLPMCFSCYQPPLDAPEVSGLPARANGYITFGSFNSPAKITPEVLATWAKILQAVPGSRVTLKNFGLGEKGTQQTVEKAFAELGIAPERLTLLGIDQSQNTHLQRYSDVDIALDPFPYNGVTTTCEALWMGVPVVTLAGEVHAGRVGVSLLSNLGLTELIGHAPEEYIATTRRLAMNLEHLNTLRKELRTRLEASPLTDRPRFTKNLEKAYLDMWRGWCLDASAEAGGE